MRLDDWLDSVRNSGKKKQKQSGVNNTLRKKHGRKSKQGGRGKWRCNGYWRKVHSGGGKTKDWSNRKGNDRHWRTNALRRNLCGGWVNGQRGSKHKRPRNVPRKLCVLNGKGSPLNGKGKLKNKNACGRQRKSPRDNGTDSGALQRNEPKSGRRGNKRPPVWNEKGHEKAQGSPR
jgi:hypothetical protein